MNKHVYQCGFCGSEHDLPVERAKCELACAEKKEAEERKAAERKKKAEYAERKAEVDVAFNTAYELRDKFIEDYGNYTHSWVYKGDGNMPGMWRFFM